MSKVSLKTLSFIIVAFLLWGNAFIAIGYLLKSLTPFELLLFRFFPVTVYCLVMSLTVHREEFWYLLRNHLGRVALCGLVMVIGYHFSLNLGQGYVTPQAASLLVTSAPLITLLLAAGFLGEKLTGRRMLGAVVAFCGMTLVVLLGKVGSDPQLFIPLDKLPYALALLVCAASTATYVVMAKSLSEKVSPAGLNYTTMTIGSIPLLFFWSPEGGGKDPDPGLAPAGGPGLSFHRLHHHRLCAFFARHKKLAGFQHLAVHFLERAFYHPVFIFVLRPGDHHLVRGWRGGHAGGDISGGEQRRGQSPGQGGPALKRAAACPFF